MIQEEHFSLWVTASDKTQRPARWRIAVSRKQVRFATQRNRWKRRIREILRRRREMIQPGHQVTLRVRSVARPLTHAELESEILELLRRAKLLVQK